MNIVCVDKRKRIALKKAIGTTLYSHYKIDVDSNDVITLSPIKIQSKAYVENFSDVLNNKGKKGDND